MAKIARDKMLTDNNDCHETDNGPPGAVDPSKFRPSKKAFVVIVGLISIFNSNLGSSLPSGAAAEIMSDFSITKEEEIVWLNSLYLIGYTIGPLVFGPLSEHVGRRPVLIATHIAYLLCTIGCALSPTYGVLLLFRGLAGVAAAAPNVVVGALFADIFEDPTQRGKSVAAFMAVATTGPATGPVISGSTSHTSWRLCFWIGLAIAVAGLPCVLFLPETCRDVLHRQHQTSYLDTTNIIRGSDSRISTPSNITVVFSRPIVMICREPIVSFISIYLALVYSILYLFFQAYPIIFGTLYSLSPRAVGLAFLPISIGAVIAFLIFLLFDAALLRARSNKAPWALKDKYARLPLACLGGPCVTIALFWLGSTSNNSIAPIVPMMAGVMFGAGYFFTFFAMLGYLTDAYKQFSASAHAAASTTRSIAGVCLPFATSSMYATLGTRWACFVLGFAALVVSVIPFVFIYYDTTIRERSHYCQEIRKQSQAQS